MEKITGFLLPTIYDSNISRKVDQNVTIHNVSHIDKRKAIGGNGNEMGKNRDKKEGVEDIQTAFTTYDK
jgi:hypothetical protein